MSEQEKPHRQGLVDELHTILENFRGESATLIPGVCPDVECLELAEAPARQSLRELNLKARDQGASLSHVVHWQWTFPLAATTEFD